MPTTKQPTDHLTKGGNAKGYTFTSGGKKYTLPPSQDAVSKIPGRFLRNAVMGGEDGQLALGFAMLENVDADPAAVEAIYDMPAEQTLTILQEWMQHKTDDAEASVGESSGSSD